MSSPIIVWFRNDLRLADHPALWHAAQKGKIIPIYIYEEEKLGGAQKVWLYHSLNSLSKQIPLIIRKGDPYEILTTLQKETGAEIYANRGYEPREIRLESQLENLTTFKGNLLVEPWDVSPKTSPYFKVFTPFWKKSLQLIEPDPPLSVPKFSVYQTEMKSDSLDPCPKWARGIESFWKFGEEAAHQRLEHFIQCAMEAYQLERDLPAIDGTSLMSPYLHFGQISPRQIWNRVVGNAGAESFLRQLGWREFSFHLLHHYPKLPEKPFNQKFEAFEWNENHCYFSAWSKGVTGYPIVDAGMRQLREIGWMHNRVRMITASFLTKHLLVPWQWGAEWFFDNLVDADLANNAFGWQWVAGCGADAAPYFRVFNPTLQAEKFDAAGDYIRHWVPELGTSRYPEPIVDHKTAREEALRRYGKTR